MPEDEKGSTDTEMKANVPNDEYSNHPVSHEADESRSSTQLNTGEHASFNDLSVEKMPEVVAVEQSVSATPAEPATGSDLEPKVSNPNTPGVLILQWLTYAFWGWTLIALYWLTSLSVQYFVSDSSETDSYSASHLNDMLAYSLAAVVVLFIISIICDIMYSKFEPRRKSGAAMVIMIIHAVIFALCGIGSLIVAVFAVVNMLISGENEAALTTLITAAIMTVLYAATLVRALHPEKLKSVTKIFWLVMLIASVTIGGLGIFGPVAYAQRTKNDRAVESALPSIASAVNDYADEQGKLPSSLKDSKLLQSYSIDSDEDAKRLIDENLVKYVAKEKLLAPIDDLGASSDMSMQSYRLDDKKSVYHYQLCVTYDSEKKSGYDYGYRTSDNDDQQYDTRPETSRHSAGEVCYDLQTSRIY